MLLLKVRISVQNGRCDYAPQDPPFPRNSYATGHEYPIQLRHWPRVPNTATPLATSTQWIWSTVPFLRNGNRPKWTRTCPLPRLHDQRHTTFGRTPLDEWSARRIDLHLTTHNTHKRQTFMPAAEFEPAIPASERPYNQALDCTVTVYNYSIADYISRLRKLLWNVAYFRTSERERERERRDYKEKSTYGKI